MCILFVHEAHDMNLTRSLALKLKSKSGFSSHLQTPYSQLKNSSNSERRQWLLRLKRGNLMYRFRWCLRLQGFNMRKQRHLIGIFIWVMAKRDTTSSLCSQSLIWKPNKTLLSKSTSTVFGMCSYIRWYTLYYTLGCSLFGISNIYTQSDWIMCICSWSCWEPMTPLAEVQKYVYGCLIAIV